MKLRARDILPLWTTFFLKFCFVTLGNRASRPRFDDDHALYQSSDDDYDDIIVAVIVVVAVVIYVQGQDGRSEVSVLNKIRLKF